MKPTKQQAISLHLAKWLGYSRAATYPNPLIAGQTIVLIDPIVGWEQFDPFASTTEGRAQFAECVIKAVADAEIELCFYWQTVVTYTENKKGGPVVHNRDKEMIVPATLEAIYYAIGGVREWVE